MWRPRNRTMSLGALKKFPGDSVRIFVLLWSFETKSHAAQAGVTLTL